MRKMTIDEGGRPAGGIMNKINRRRFLFTILGLAAIAGIPDIDSLTKPQQEIPTSEPIVPDDPFRDLYGALLEPFVKEAGIGRAKKMESDPGYNSRIDWEFSRRRINFLLFGFGETHEPPLTERAGIGSISVFSLDIPSREIDIVSFTHDIRAPEIERYQKERGNNNPFPTKIYRAYEFGGFPLLAEIMENSTGLSIDFQVAFHDRFIKKVVDDVLWGVEIEVEEEFSVYPFYLDSIKYPKRTFPQGRQELDGLGTLSFIKTVPDTKGKPTSPKNQEHNYRKHLVVQGFAKKLRENIKNPMFLLKLSRLLQFKSNDSTLNYDFDPQNLLFGNIASVAGEAGKMLLGGETGTPFTVGRTLYIVDYAHGDGGVQWVNASQSPVIVDEVKKGRFPDRAMEVPINANPNAENLALGYWLSVRKLIKDRLNI